MTDGIVKGTGNSRYLKSVANAMTLYPTYEDFIAALVAGTFPVDFNGQNANGWQQKGTNLNKASLLTDVTENSIWGSSANRTVDAALFQLNSAIDAVKKSVGTTQSYIPRVVTGSYTGTGATTMELSGVYGTPKFLFIGERGNYMGILSVPTTGATTNIANNNSYKGVTLSLSGYKLTITGNTNNVASFNYNGTKYMYFLLYGGIS